MVVQLSRRSPQASRVAPGPTRRRAYLVPTATFAVGGILGLLVTHEERARSPGADGTGAVEVSVVRDDREPFQFIHPLMRVAVRDRSAPNAAMQELLRNVAAAAVAAGDATAVGAYFADLESGRWAGAGEDERFVPASLYKVPLLIAYLRAAETDPSLLKKAFVYGGSDWGVKQNVVPAETLERGKAYTVDTLLARLIVYSDNASYELLVSGLDQKWLEGNYRDLLNSGSHGSYDPATTTPRAYGAIFEMLYDATYLGHEMSERALNLMTNADFHAGLVAGVGEGVKVSHKFGERTNEYPGGSDRSLHDCGVVYLPGSPYVLCVMTHGADYARLTGVLARLSRAVFQRMTQAPIATTGAGSAGQ